MKDTFFLKKTLQAAVVLTFGLAMPVLAITDTVAPTVSAVTPASVTAGVPTVFSITYNDPAPSSNVTVCNLYYGGGSLLGAMTLGPNLTNDTATYTYTFSSAGTPVLDARCDDVSGNTGFGQTTTINVAADTTAPTIGTISPSVTTAGVSTTLSTSVSDNVGVTSCYLYVSGVNQGVMTISGGVASRNHTFPDAGFFAVQVRCSDLAANVGEWNLTMTVNAAADVTPPTVGLLQQSTAVAGTATILSATYSDNVAVTACSLIVNSADQGIMTLSGGLASRSHTFSTAGSYSVFAKCNDGVGNITNGAPHTVIVSAPPVDTALPVVNMIDQTTAVQNTAITLTTSWSDNIGVTACSLFVDGTDWGGTMSITGVTAGTASISVAFSAAGSHSVQVRCRDAAGNFGWSSPRTIAVSVAATVPDTAAPSVGQIQQSVGTAGTSSNLTALYSDNVGVTFCELYVNGANQGAMTLNGSSASRSYAFAGAGTYSAYARCRDAVGNTAAGATMSIVVSVAGTINPGMLIKLVCPSGADVNHPCKAVYYNGADGRRHAFPNEKVYFTWYVNFSTVQEVSDVAMANIPLGRNVNYRPGIRMVKFQTVPKVYAVGRYGVLRWVTSEALAISMYGTNWNQRIDDISEAFYTNYTFGTDINSASQFNPTNEASAVLNIDANL